MTECRITDELRRSIARRDRYDRGERVVLWICAAIVFATFAWKAYQAIVTHFPTLIPRIL